MAQEAVGGSEKELVANDKGPAEKELVANEPAAEKQAGPVDVTYLAIQGGSRVVEFVEVSDENWVCLSERPNVTCRGTLTTMCRIPGACRIISMGGPNPQPDTTQISFHTRPIGKRGFSNLSDEPCVSRVNQTGYYMDPLSDSRNWIKFSVNANGREYVRYEPITAQLGCGVLVVAGGLDGNQVKLGMGVAGPRVAGCEYFDPVQCRFIPGPVLPTTADAITGHDGSVVIQVHITVSIFHRRGVLMYYISRRMRTETYGSCNP